MDEDTFDEIFLGDDDIESIIEDIFKPKFLKPSEEKDHFWIYCFSTIAVKEMIKKRDKSEFFGKWLIFPNKMNVDYWWSLISKSTRENKLGPYSVVSTMKPNPHSSNPNAAVICVFTYDYRDENDVFRVRCNLRDIGVKQKIPYKTDKATKKNLYRVTGAKKISLYYC